MRISVTVSQSTSPRWSWYLAGALSLLSMISAVFYGVTPDSLKAASAFNDVVDIAALFYLAWFCLKDARQLIPGAGLPPCRKHLFMRLSPVFWGLALFSGAISEMFLFVQNILLNLSPSYPSLAHLFCLAMFPFVIGGVLCLLSHNLSAASRLRIFVDSLIIMTTVVTLCFYFLFFPILRVGNGTAQEKIFGLIYPLADLVTFFCLLLVGLRSNEPAVKLVLVLLGIAQGILFGNHVIQFGLLLSAGYSGLAHLSATISLSMLLMVASALIIRQAVSTERPPVCQPIDPAPSGVGKALFPYLLALILGGFTLFLWLQGQSELSYGANGVVYLGCFLSLLLLVLRQFLGVYDVNTLQRELQEKNHSLHLLNTQLEKQATSDLLTCLPNRLELLRVLDQMLMRTDGKQALCSVIFLDIDLFKKINDHYGHLVGDEVLHQFGMVVKETLRVQDCLGRWGGEEFVAVLPETTKAQAFQLAEDIRVRVAEQTFAGDRCLRISCSLGIATYPCGVADRAELLLRADEALYTAKRLGRNQTRC